MSRFWEAAITKHCSSCVTPKPADCIWHWEILPFSSLILTDCPEQEPFFNPLPGPLSLPVPKAPLSVLFSILCTSMVTSSPLSFNYHFYMEDFQFFISASELFLKRQFHIVSRLPTRSIWKAYQLLQLGISDLKFRIFCWRFSSFTFNTWGPWYLL